MHVGKNDRAPVREFPYTGWAGEAGSGHVVAGMVKHDDELIFQEQTTE